MSEMYTGWDGKPYPWPPPEGWYEASDGRWWAPGTGPTPPPASNPNVAQPQSMPQTAAASEAVAPPPGIPAQSHGLPSADVAPPQASYDEGHTNQLPTYDAAGSGGGFDPNATAVSAAGYGSGPPPGGPYAGTNEWETPPLAGQPPSDGGGSGRILLASLGVVLALAVAGGAYLLLRDDNGDTAATDEAGSTTETSADGDADTGSTTADGDDPETSATTASGDGTDSTSATEETATSESSTETTEPTSTTASAADQVPRFRDILDTNGLTSTELTDDDIATFGTTFCIFAVASESPTEYGEFRERAVAETESELTNEELALVIDAAVVVFCPDQATRLGIDL